MCLCEGLSTQNLGKESYFFFLPSASLDRVLGGVLAVAIGSAVVPRKEETRKKEVAREAVKGGYSFLSYSNSFTRSEQSCAFPAVFLVSLVV